MVEKEFREGWSALAIYERHKDELGPTISYRQFLRYVSEWRPEKSKPERKAQASVKSAPPVTPPSPVRAPAADALVADDPDNDPPPPKHNWTPTIKLK